MSILAIDVGSSSVRALLFETIGDSVHLIPDAIVQRHYQFDTDKEGRATVDAVFLRELLESCIDDLLQHESAREINLVGMATFAGNLLLLDGNNQPIAPLDTYADTRSATYVESLREKLDMTALHQRTGAILNSAYYLPKLCFYDYPHNAEAFVLAFSDFATYCYREWFGRPVPMTYSIASWSGMLNRKTLDWDEESLGASHYSREMFPELADFTDYQQGLSEKYSQRWQALADVPFYLAVGDGAAAQVGSGALKENTATLTIGTTAAIRTVKRDILPDVPDGSWSYRIDERHHLSGGALSEGGNIFAWAKNTLKMDDVDIEAELTRREPGTHGLTVLPLLNGERSPGWRNNATGTIHGLRLNTSPMDILHALLESVALRLAMIASQLKLDSNIQMMTAGGALHQSPAWAQMIANALGRQVVLINEAEVTATGVAQMVHSAHITGNITENSPDITNLYKPDTNHFVIFEALQAQQERLYALTDDL